MGLSPTSPPRENIPKWSRRLLGIIARAGGRLRARFAVAVRSHLACRRSRWRADAVRADARPCRPPRVIDLFVAGARANIASASRVFATYTPAPLRSWCCPDLADSQFRHPWGGEDRAATADNVAFGETDRLRARALQSKLSMLVLSLIVADAAQGHHLGAGATGRRGRRNGAGAHRLCPPTSDAGTKSSNARAEWRRLAGPCGNGATRSAPPHGIVVSGIARARFCAAG